MSLPAFLAGAVLGGTLTMVAAWIMWLSLDGFAPDIDEPDPADNLIGDQPAIPGGRVISYTYLLVDDYGNVAPGQTEYDDPAEVQRHWVGPIVKVTREWGAES